METIIGAIFGAFGLGIITAVFAFCRERLNTADKQYNDCRAETMWYRDKLLPILEHVLPILEHQQETIETRSQLMLDALEELRQERGGHADK